MARATSEKTDELQKLGAEIILADFLDLSSLEKALEGVDRAYLAYPPDDRLLEATANFIVAAQANDVEAIANMSQMPVRKYHESPLSNQHWLAERMLDQTNMLVAHIRPGFFAEMLYLMNGANILQEGKMYLPHGDAYHAPIAGEDIGRSVAAILEKPKDHDGQCYYLTGPKRLSQSDIAAIASDALGIPIEYTSVSYDQWAESMKQTGLFNDFLVKHLVEVGKDYQDGVFDKVTSAVEDLTGREPMDMKTFIESNKTFFTPDFLQALSQKMVAQKQSVQRY